MNVRYGVEDSHPVKVAILTLAQSDLSSQGATVMHLSGKIRLAVVAGSAALAGVAWNETSFWRHYLFDNYFVGPTWAIWTLSTLVALAIAAWVAMGFRASRSRANQKSH